MDVIANAHAVLRVEGLSRLAADWQGYEEVDGALTAIPGSGPSRRGTLFGGVIDGGFGARAIDLVSPSTFHQYSRVLGLAFALLDLSSMVCLVVEAFVRC
jgi:hypothetical protein